MDEKLKNQVMIAIVAAGIVFMIWMFWTFFSGGGGLAPGEAAGDHGRCRRSGR